MHPIIQNMKNSQKTVPCLFYPAILRNGFTVKEILTDAQKQAELLQLIAQQYPVGAVIRMSELWCEAKAFGVDCTFSANGFPTLGNPLCEEAEELHALEIPSIDNETLTIMLKAVQLSAGKLNCPLIAGITGPYTLGTVLCGSEDFMMACMTEEEETAEFMQKLCDFLIAYAKAYKQAGANGIMIAEPTTSMISPAMMSEFSNQYISRIIDAVQDDSFAVIYHNCGAVNPHLQTIAELPAAAFHFGSEVDLTRARTHIASDVPIMGNLDPRRMLHATPESISASMQTMKETYHNLENWILSTGCDLSPKVSEENLTAFFA